MLILQRRAGESLLIGEDITVSVVSIDGVRVRLAISAPDHVSILRSELAVASAANRDSAMEESAPNELLSLLGGVLDTQRESSASKTEEIRPEPNPKNANKQNKKEE